MEETEEQRDKKWAEDQANWQEREFLESRAKIRRYLKLTNKNKKLLIDLMDMLQPGWYGNYKYMWQPFSTEDLVQVRKIAHDFYAKFDFDLQDKKVLRVFMLGAFNNIKELTKKINMDFISSMKDLERTDLDVNNVWHTLEVISHFVNRAGVHNRIWHDVVPNALEIRVQDVNEANEKDRLQYGYSNKANHWYHDEPYTTIGIVQREGWHPSDAYWERSEFHKEAYLDQKLKGRI